MNISPAMIQCVCVIGFGTIGITISTRLKNNIIRNVSLPAFSMLLGLGVGMLWRLI